MCCRILKWISKHYFIHFFFLLNYIYNFSIPAPVFPETDIGYNSRVLLHHSYHHRFNWSVNVTAGMASVIEQTAVELACRILKDVKARDIPPVLKSPNVRMFDFERVQEFGIKENRLPENAVVFNKTFSFYEENKIRIWFGVIIVVGELFLIIALWTNLIKRKKCGVRSTLRRG